MEAMNPALVEKIKPSLALVTVFWSSQDWVANELVAKE